MEVLPWIVDFLMEMLKHTSQWLLFPLPAKTKRGSLSVTHYEDKVRFLEISHPPLHSKIKASTDKFLRFVVKFASLFSAFLFYVTIAGAFSSFNWEDYIFLVSTTCLLISAYLNIYFFHFSFIFHNFKYSTMFIVLCNNFIIWHLKNPEYWELVCLFFNFWI